MKTLLMPIIRLLVTQCLFFPIYSIAQKPKGVIKGRVLDANNYAAANVIVELKANKRAIVTDNSGLFILDDLHALTDTLVISSIEANLLTVAITLHEGETIDIGVKKLEYYTNQLQDVEIRGRLAQSYKSDYSFFGSKTETPSKDIPQSIATITKELMKDKMEFTLKDAVDEAAGVNQYSGFDEYTIRGFRAENSRDINGLRGYNTTYTSSMLVNIERVEIIKGPTATLYGNCDPGGTINLVTKKPLKKNESEIDVYGGSWNHFRAVGDITGPVNKSKTLLYRFNAGYDNTGSFRNEQYAKSFELAPSVTYMPNSKLQANFDFSLSHINTVLDWGQPGLQNTSNLHATPISLSASQNGDKLQETDMASVLTLSYKISKSFSFNTGFLHYSTNQHVITHGVQGYITPDSVNLYCTAWSYPTVTNTISNYFTYKFNAGKASSEIVIGYDYIRSKVNLYQQYYELPDQFGAGSGIVGTFSLKKPVYTNTPVASYQLSDYDDDGTDVNSNIYHTQGVYAQNQVSWGKWKILFSLREEFYKGDDVGDSSQNLSETVFLPRVGLVYRLYPNISTYVTYNKGFDAFEASTSTQVFNAPFKPQISELLEAGLKGNFLNNRLSASVAIYQLTLNNVAVNANILSNPNLYVQQGQNQSKGIEFETAGNILSNLSVMFSYSNSVAKVTQSKIPSQVGMLVANAPRNTSGSWVKYTFSKGFLKGFGLSAGHSGVGVRNTLAPGIILPGYLVINGGMHYRYKKMAVALNVNNINNATYWTGAYNNVNKWPGAQRNFMLNVGYRF